MFQRLVQFALIAIIVVSIAAAAVNRGSRFAVSEPPLIVVTEQQPAPVITEQNNPFIAALNGASSAVLKPQRAKVLVAFRGINSLLDEKAVKAWAKQNGYAVKIYDYPEVNAAAKYVDALNDSADVDVLGFSRGAVSAYQLVASTPDEHYNRLITVGAVRSVTTSFGNGERPKPSNVGQHLNFSESWQQPDGFSKNPINISVGDVEHMDSVGKALEMLSNGVKIAD